MINTAELISRCKNVIHRAEVLKEKYQASQISVSALRGECEKLGEEIQASLQRSARIGR